MKNYHILLSNPAVLQPDEGAEILNQIFASAGPNDADFNELFDNFIDDCVTYAQIRGNWDKLDRENRITGDVDANRTLHHNLIISDLTILERYLNNQGKNGAWRDAIGRQTHGNERKRQGDFACFVAYVSAPGAR